MDADRLARLEALGLLDGTDDRLALLDLLVADGASDEEMAAAHADGRLFALSGDRVLRAGPRTESLTDAADALGMAPADLTRVWHALGLPDPPPGEPVLSAGEVADLEVLRDVVAALGVDATAGVARVMGAAVARVAEAESSAVRRATEDIDLDVSQSEVATALAWRATAELVPRIGRLLAAAHRRHLELTAAYFESLALRGHGTEGTLGVGFVDLSGFTALSATTTLPSLSRLLSVFEERASDTVTAGGGRLVKFLGDAVMYAAVDRPSLLRIALDLVADPVAAAAGIIVRGGVAWGDVLVQDGDYFGTPVNLAARLVALAPPGSVLASPELAGVDGFATTRLPGQVVRGFEAPLDLVLLEG